MESNLVAEFVGKTGSSAMVAHNYLQAKKWDLQLAIHDYLSSKDDDANSEKPVLSKCDSIDVTDSTCKKLARGISRATDNVNLVSKARCELGLDFRENNVCNVNQYFIETPVFTFTLPDLSIYPDDFRQFLEKDLIEMSSLVSLEQAGRLNWWADNGVCQRLWPLATTGDGNCLLHAASLGMWGFHDRLLTLRKALHEFLSASNCRDALYRRWRWQLTRLNAEAGLVYTEEEWRKEWNSIVSMASSTPRNSSSRRRSIVVDKSSSKEVSENATYESLEEIHVLALSHVLKRPIIVIADTMLKDVHGENLAPILFGGIYLPLEIPPTECHRSPLVLTYDAAHFSALVVMDKETFADKAPHPPAVIPLTDSQHKLLPVQFSVDPGQDFVWGRDETLPHVTERLSLGNKEIHALLREYLDVVHVPISLTPVSDDTEFEIELETPGDEEDIEKRFYEATESELDDGSTINSETGLFGTNKSKAAKQLQSVAKQFGSIGKSMSKKLKKNLGTITKMTRNNSQKKDVSSRPRLTNDDSSKSQDYILSARLHTEARHEYQEEMIKNYLNTARDRFEREKKLKQKLAEENLNLDDEKLQEQAKLEGPKNCITQGCNMYGTVLTAYLCTSCYEKQRQEELNSSINSPSLPRAIMIPQKTQPSPQGTINVDPPRIGTGRSTFYFEASPKSYETAKNFSMVQGRTLKPADETLYLSNSTFYNDRNTQAGFYPKDWKSSPAGTGRNANQYSLPNDFRENNKTWQEGITNQIDGLGSVTLPAGFSTSSNQTWNNSNGESGLKRIQSYNLARDTYQPNSKDGNLLTIKGTSPSQPLRSRNSVPGAANITISNITPLRNQIQSRSSTDLPDIENVSRPNSQTRLSDQKTSSENFVTTIPVRQSSQNNLDQLIKETTEYLNKNNENKAGTIGLTRVIPIEVEKSPNSVEGNLKNGYITQVDVGVGKKLSDSYVDRKTCLNVTCKFFGSPELDNYCSKCYRGRFESLAVDSTMRK